MKPRNEAERQQAALREFVQSGSYQTRVYGLEWGDPLRDPVQKDVLERFLRPYLYRDSSVLEIGSGGGRWSREMAGQTRRLILVDGVPEFEAAIGQHVPGIKAEFIVCPDGRLDSIPEASIDFVFSFDTFVHFHNELFDIYVESVGRILRPGGHFVLHHARHFPGCPYDPNCFQYRDESDVKVLLDRSMMYSISEYAIPSGYGSRVVLAQKQQ